MSVFDAPIAACSAIHEMVLTDETQRECAAEHECPPGRECPLDGCFADVSGVAESATQEMLQAVRH